MLQELATLYLGMSAGSVPVESLFSITGLILNSRRSSLDPSKLHKISILHDNLQFVIDGLASDDVGKWGNDDSIHETEQNELMTE
jgi:hypothetical protein